MIPYILTVEQKEEYSTFEGVQLILKQKNPKLAKTLNVKSFQTVLYVLLIEHLLSFFVVFNSLAEIKKKIDI